MTHFTPALARTAALAALVLAACHRPAPPAALPGVSGPRETFVNTACVFRATAADSQSIFVRVRFDWGDGDTSSWSESLPAGRVDTALHFWTRTGTYLISVQARNSDGELSDWTAPCTLVVVNRAPDRPLFGDSVPDGYVDSTYSFTLAANDMDGESLSYRIAWGDGDTLAWTAPSANGTWLTKSHTWRTFGTFTLCAQARDAHDSVSAWSESLLVTIRTVPPAIKWRFEVGDRILSSPAIGHDGAIYFGSSDNYFYCLNPDGTLRWRYATYDNIESPPVIAPDGTIYVAGMDMDDVLYALRPDGTLKWRRDTTNGTGPAPALGADGTIYVAGHRDSLYALDDTGGVRWTSACRSIARYPPSVGPDGMIYTVWNSDRLYATSPSGSALWHTEGDYRAAPAIDNAGTVYGAGSHILSARAPDSTLLWQVTTPFSKVTEPLIGGDGTIYVGSLTGQGLLAVNADGTQKWTTGLGANFASLGLALLADGTIIAGMNNGYVYAISDDGRVKWRYHTGPINESSPAVAPDGTIYIGAIDGHLYAIAGTSPLANAPWPKYRHDNRNTGRSGGP